MKARIKEIRDRVDKATDWREGREDLINNACEDIEYLLAALEEAHNEIDNMERIGTDICADLKESQDRERVLREALGILVDKYVANRGTEHQFISCITPTVMPDYWINAMEALGQEGK